MLVVKTKRTKHFTGHGDRSLLYPKGSKVETCLTKTQMCPVACVAGAEFFEGEGRNFEDERAPEGRGPHKN